MRSGHETPAGVGEEGEEEGALSTPRRADRLSTAGKLGLSFQRVNLNKLDKLCQETHMYGLNVWHTFGLCSKSYTLWEYVLVK
jgi:hypothetical protein